jgi:predicted nucleic acid-binding protein
VIERDFEFLPDSREVHDRWRRLLVRHDVKGVQVHDARLAASMYVHGVTQLLTVNVRDFQRFEGLRATHPTDVTRPAQPL